jgi:hypothetical protein
MLNRHGSITSNKMWEFEILKTNLLFGFTLEFKTHTDHAGLNLELGMFGYELSFMIYDTRHYPHESVK